MKMSNRVCIEPTKFVNLRSEPEDCTLGVRVYDDYGQTYDNRWDSIPDDDMDVLRKALDELKMDEIFTAMMDHIATEGKGIYIGDQWYNFPEIKDILSEAGFESYEGDDPTDPAQQCCEDAPQCDCSYLQNEMESNGGY
jgi:hypothetical protein